MATQQLDYPLRSLEEFAGWLMSCGIIDECAYWDAENYDGGQMIARMERALAKVADNDKISDECPALTPPTEKP